MMIKANCSLFQWYSNFQVRTKHGQGLAVDVVYDSRSKQQTANPPAQMFDRSPADASLCSAVAIVSLRLVEIQLVLLRAGSFSVG